MSGAPSSARALEQELNAGEVRSSKSMSPAPEHACSLSSNASPFRTGTRAPLLFEPAVATEPAGMSGERSCPGMHAVLVLKVRSST